MNLETLIWTNYGKLVMFLLMATILLQSYHLMCLIRIQDSTTVQADRNNHDKSSRGDLQKSRDLKSQMQTAVQKLDEAHKSDPSGSYFIIPGVVESEVDHAHYTVALCTQTTANHLHYVAELSESWSAPVSVSVFTHGLYTAQDLYTILYMHTCYPSVRKYVTFHMMFPIRHPPVDLHQIFDMTIDCDVYSGVYLQDDEQTLNYEHDIPYPHNILRNIAITFTTSPYIFVIDIDMIPSSKLATQFKSFIQRRSVAFVDKADGDKQKLVYVVPAFESKVSMETMTKESLIKQWDVENVRPFYSKMCWKCQRVTDYDQWRALPNLPFLDTGYILDWEDPWEPFYIARKSDLPLYDGRFKQYGFNRISQVCEVHVVGYRFAVLNNAFLVHRDFKEIGLFHDKKEAENLKNKELFRQFKLDLKDRYPDIKREC